MSYTRLGVTPKEMREKLKGRLDNWATFGWDNVEDAFEEFGLFIINEHSLKFYNGANFKNEYSTTQFGNKNLLGVTFNTQTIDFKVGMYYFTIEEYRKMLAWLNPYTIANLHFTFDPMWAYQVKLANRSDSVREVIGYTKGQPCYYTEFTLKFEVQGDPVARRRDSYELEKVEAQSGALIRTWNLRADSTGVVTSDLDMPFEWTCSVDKIDAENIQYLQLIGNIVINKQTLRCFDIVFQHLSPIASLVFQYNSETGLCYWDNNDEKQLLTQLVTQSQGQSLVYQLHTNKQLLLGKLSSNGNWTAGGVANGFSEIKNETTNTTTRVPTYSSSSVQLQLQCIPYSWDGTTADVDDMDINANLQAYARTNVL